MRELLLIENHNVSGGSRLTRSLQAAFCSTLGLSVGAVIGAQCTPFLMNARQESQDYTTQIKNYFIDSMIAYHMGTYGINSSASFLGCLGGSLIGCVAGSAVFGFIT